MQRYQNLQRDLSNRFLSRVEEAITRIMLDPRGHGAYDYSIDMPSYVKLEEVRAYFPGKRVRLVGGNVLIIRWYTPGYESEEDE